MLWASTLELRPGTTVTVRPASNAAAKMAAKNLIMTPTPGSRPWTVMRSIRSLVAPGPPPVQGNENFFSSRGYRRRPGAPAGLAGQGEAGVDPPHVADRALRRVVRPGHQWPCRRGPAGRPARRPARGAV